MANQIKIPATASTRAVQKMTIPWDDGSGNNLYLNFDPEFVGTQDVIITSDENPKDESRTKNLVFKTSTPGLSSGQQSQATLEIVQTPSVITYELQLQSVTGSGSIDDNNKSQVNIPASGGLVSLVFRVAKYINGKFDSYYQSNITQGITHSDTSAYNWVEFESGNEFSVDSRGTTEGVVRSTGAIQYTWNNRDKLNPVQVSMSVIVQQKANVKTLQSLSINDPGTLFDVPAGGDTTYNALDYWTGYKIGANYKFTSGLSITDTVEELNTDEWRLIYTQNPPTSIPSLGATPKARSMVDNFEWRVQAIGDTSIKSEKIIMEIYQQANTIKSVSTITFTPNFYRLGMPVKDISGSNVDNAYYEPLSSTDTELDVKAIVPAGGGSAAQGSSMNLTSSTISQIVFYISNFTMTSGYKNTNSLSNVALETGGYNTIGILTRVNIPYWPSLSAASRGTTPGDERSMMSSRHIMDFSLKNTSDNTVLKEIEMHYSLVQEANYIVDMPNINLTSFIDSSYIPVGPAAGGSININDNPFNGLSIPSGSTFTSGSKTTSATYVDMNGIWEAIGKYGVKLIAEFTAGQPPYTFADGSTDEFDLTEAFKDKPYNSSVEFIKGFPNLGTTVTQVSDVTAIRFRMEATDTHSGTSTELTSTSYAIKQAANRKFSYAMAAEDEDILLEILQDPSYNMNNGYYGIRNSPGSKYQYSSTGNNNYRLKIFTFDIYTSRATANIENRTQSDWQDAYLVLNGQRYSEEFNASYQGVNIQWDGYVYNNPMEFILNLNDTSTKTYLDISVDRGSYEGRIYFKWN